jgi:putative addiction module killer protein
MKRYVLSSTIEYDEWEESQTKKSQQQIAKRLALIQEEGHFGDHKSVSDDDSVWELKWRNGRRIYYSYIKESNVLVILGGSKNGQEKDIEKAGRILSKRKTS